MQIKKETKTKKAELALKTVNLIRDWHRKLLEMNTLYVSDLGDMESLIGALKQEYGFRYPTNDSGDRNYHGDLVPRDDPNAWHHKASDVE